MGEIVGDVLGIGGALLGGSSSKSNAYKGFSYLANSPVGQTIVPNAGRANQAEADLLGVGGDPAKANEAFQNYLNSSGYNFQLGQGSQAITTNNASKGLLNSGATLKALTKYGQNLGSTSFNNYLSQLGGLTTQGLSGAGMIGQAGTAGGKTASENGGSGIGKALGIAAGMFL